MSRPHMLDHILGQQLVNSLQVRRRRKTDAELEAMAPEDRVAYRAANPLTDEEKYAALKREVDGLDYAMTGDLPPEIILSNEPPSGWGA